MDPPQRARLPGSSHAASSAESLPEHGGRAGAADRRAGRHVAFAEAAGITTILRKDLSLALGSSEVRLIDLVNAYAVFPSGGLALPPQWFLSVGEKKTERPEVSRVMDPASAWLMTSLLRTVVTEGTGHRAAVLKFPVAGKTGTTNDNRDAWFVGFSPELVCGVWIGYDDLKPLACCAWP